MDALRYLKDDVDEVNITRNTETNQHLYMIFYPTIYKNDKIFSDDSTRAYLSSIIQNTSCEILVNGNRQWRHLAHNARHPTHAAQSLNT